MVISSIEAVIVSWSIISFEPFISDFYAVDISLNY